jgi:hypothetical protein
LTDFFYDKANGRIYMIFLRDNWITFQSTTESHGSITSLADVLLYVEHGYGMFLTESQAKKFQAML